MLIELPLESFIKIKPMLGDLSHYLVLSMLLDGKTPGRIWVNRNEAPTTALVWDRVNTLFFLVGDSTDEELNRELNRLIMDSIFPEAIQSQYRKFFLQFAPHFQWKEQVGVILKGTVPDQQSIYAYELSPTHLDHTSLGQQSLPAGYRLSRITPNIIKKPNLKNLDDVRYAIRACWGSTDRYFDQDGIGFCLFRDDEIASWCSTDYVINSACELYVETFEGHKQQGLGTLVAQACVKECLEHGLVVYWHCFNYAIGSVKIAKKLNLAKIAETSVYVIDLERINRNGTA